MRNARLALRAAGLLVVTAGTLAVWLAGSLPAWTLHRVHAWRALVTHLWARAVARVIGMCVRVEGRAGREPCLWVANHLSYVDVVLLACVGPCTFVAKSEVARWPVLGALARSMGTLFVQRSRRGDVVRLGRELRARLSDGRRIALFPEGTSTAGGTVLPFHPALLEPAVELGLPVRYAALSYETAPGDPPARLAVCWWGEMTFLRHLSRLLCLRGFVARVVLGDEALLEPDRKVLARRLRAAVAERLRLGAEGGRA